MFVSPQSDAVEYVTNWFHNQAMTMGSHTGHDEQLDSILHALADRTRRALLKRLTEGPAMVTELAAPFRMTRIAVAKHLRVLEDAGLISRSIEGRIHRCSLEPTPLREVEAWLCGYRQFWDGSLESLARYVEDDIDQKSRRKK